MKLIKKIIRNEAIFLLLIGAGEVIRIFMKAGEYLAIDLMELIVLSIIVAIGTIIQQILKNTNSQNHSC